MIFNLTTPAVSKLPKFTYTGTSELIDDGGKNWRIKFLTSGVLTLFKKLIVDVFLVGGGGAATGASGAGGGYTKTVQSVELEPGSYEIVVGAGGVSADGGTTTAFGISAKGGKKGDGYTPGDGASGGGSYITSESAPFYPAGTGGSDGSNGGGAPKHPGGTGQGTTTREFGESDGELYSGGGGGSYPSGSGIGASGGAGGGGNGRNNGTPATDGAANSGGGGGGGSNVAATGGNGGSGIAIMRNHREVAA